MSDCEIVTYLRELAAREEGSAEALREAPKDCETFVYSAQLLRAIAGRIERGAITEGCTTPGCIACARERCG